MEPGWRGDGAYRNGGYREAERGSGVSDRAIGRARPVAGARRVAGPAASPRPAVPSRRVAWPARCPVNGSRRRPGRSRGRPASPRRRSSPARSPIAVRSSAAPLPTAAETRAREARELQRQKAWGDQASRALSAMKAEDGTGPVNADDLEDDDLDRLPLGAEEGPDGGTVLVPGGSPLPTLRVLPQGISRKRLEQAIRDLQLPVVIARDVDEADVVMTLRNEYKQKTPMLRDAEERAVPIYVLKSNTIPQMQSSLTSIFSLEIDPREAAMRETEDAIESVLSSSEAVELSPAERLHPAAPAPDGRAGEPRLAVARPGAVPAGPALSGRGAQRLALTRFRR